MSGLGQEVDDAADAVGEVLVAKGEAETSGATGAESLTRNDGDVDLLQQRRSKLEGRVDLGTTCLLYTSPSPRDRQKSRMPSSA